MYYNNNTKLLVNVKPNPIYKLLFFDLEWSLTKDMFGEYPILAASFVDSDNQTTVLLREDFLFSGNNHYNNLQLQQATAERKLLSKILDIFWQYDYSMGFYSTGIRTYNPLKRKVTGRDSDLIQLHRRLERYGMHSIVRQSDYTKIPYIRGYDDNCNNLPHLHIDAYLLFTNQVIKTSIYKGAYSANDLDTISKAIIGRGKYRGLRGYDFESLTDLDEKRRYALEDAQLLKECISKNNYELLHILNSISKLTGVLFRDVCKSKGVSKIWTPVLDDIIKKKLYNNNNSYDNNNNNRIETTDQNLIAIWSKYYKRAIFKQKEELETILDNVDPDNETDDKFILNESNNKTKTKTKRENIEHTRRYIGGLVLNPKPAEYSNVFVFDVASLYPTMIINNNLSFDSVNCECCKDNPLAQVPSEIFSDNSNSNDADIDNYVNLTKHDVIPILSSKKSKHKTINKKKDWHRWLDFGRRADSGARSRFA